MPFHGGLFSKVGGGLSTLFGGRADPKLSDEENKAASSDALIQSGLATLLASGRDGFSPTVLQALSQGIVAGREAGAASREDATEKQRLAQLKTAINEGGMDTQELFLKALSIGDLESAKLLSTLAQTELTVSGRAPQAIRTIRGTGPEGEGFYRLDSAGNLLNKILDPPSRGSAGQRFGPIQEFRSSEDGKAFMGMRDSEANDGRGGVVRVPGLLPPTTATEDAQQNLGSVGLVAQQALEPLMPVLATLTTDLVASPNFFFSTLAFSQATDRQQIAMSLADTFLNVTVRWLSGAQMTDQERTNYRRALLPRAFESEFSVRVKIIMQRNIARAMSAGLWQGQPTVDEDGNEVADSANLIAWTAQAQVDAINQVIAEMETSGEGLPTLSDLAETARQAREIEEISN